MYLLISVRELSSKCRLGDRMLNKVVSSKKFYLISLLIFFSITFLSTGNAFAGDMASVSVTIRFWSPSRAKVPADSLDRVLSDSVEKDPWETVAKKPDRKRDTSFTALATIYHVSEESDYFSNSAGGGGREKRGRKDVGKESPFEGMVDIFYDDSI